MEKKILLVDDHALYRGAIRQLIDLLCDDNIFFEAGDLAQALALAQAHPELDLVMYDLGLPDTNGLDGLVRFRQACPDVSVVVLSGEDAPEIVSQVLAAGAVGFIPKSLSNEQLAQALEFVVTGGVYVAEQMLASDLTQAMQPPPHLKSD